MFKILIADDQAPDMNLSSEEEVLEHYSKEYKDFPDFVPGFVFFYNLIKLMKAQSYEVDSANTPSRVIDLVKSKTYDIVVLDLGWWAFKRVNYDDRMIYGWRLAEEIRKDSRAQILMFSNRFYEKQDYAHRTAEMGCLPIYKSYDEACARNLLVTIRWATLVKPLAQVMTDETKIYSFKMYRRLSDVLFWAIVASVILLLVSVFLAARNYTSATVITSVFGVVSTFMNGGIYKYVSAYLKSCQ